MTVNSNKTQELMICFIKKVNIPRLCINGTEIDGVTIFQLLNSNISSDLSWDSHITYLLKSCRVIVSHVAQS